VAAAQPKQINRARHGRPRWAVRSGAEAPCVLAATRAREGRWRKAWFLENPSGSPAPLVRGFRFIKCIGAGSGGDDVLLFCWLLLKQCRAPGDGFAYEAGAELLILLSVAIISAVEVLPHRPSQRCHARITIPAVDRHPADGELAPNFSVGDQLSEFGGFARFSISIAPITVTRGWCGECLRGLRRYGGLAAGPQSFLIRRNLVFRKMHGPAGSSSVTQLRSSA